MLDLTACRDQLVPVGVIAKQFQTTTMTVERWIKVGTRVRSCNEPIYLDALMLGRAWFTTDEAVAAYSEALTLRSLRKSSPSAEKPPSVKKRIERARAALKAQGIGVPKTRKRKGAACPK